MPSAHFTITGEFLTRQARTFMLEDEPGRAYRLIADCLAGEGVGQVALELLAGETNLIGDSTKGIDVEPAGESSREYTEQLSYLYAGRVKLEGSWYRPRGVVTSWGPDDAHAAAKQMQDGAVPTTRDSAGMYKFARLRAEYYARSRERVERIGDHWVVFASCGAPPQWRQPSHTPEQALKAATDAGRSLTELGACPDTRPSFEASQIIKECELADEDAEGLRELAYAAEDAQRAAELERIGGLVREQAGEDTFTMTLQDGRKVQVPRAPFAHWALSRLENPPELPAWAKVSHSGVKMQMDDPYHTDWILGAGLTIEEGYSDNVNRPAWEHASELQFQAVDEGADDGDA